MKLFWAGICIAYVFLAYDHIDKGENLRAFVDIFFYIFFMHVYKSKGTAK